jgi:hypothetical protein
MPRYRVESGKSMSDLSPRFHVTDNTSNRSWGQFVESDNAHAACALLNLGYRGIAVANMGRSLAPREPGSDKREEPYG